MDDGRTECIENRQEGQIYIFRELLILFKIFILFFVLTYLFLFTKVQNYQTISRNSLRISIQNPKLVRSVLAKEEYIII